VPVRPTVTGPARAQRATPPTRPRVVPNLLLVTVLCIAATALATTTPTAAGAKGTTSTTLPRGTGPLAPVQRSGQPYITPGHQATGGPIGANPSTAQGVQLSVLNGLLLGLPIFEGDFADPYALVDGDSVYTYATSTTASVYEPAAHIPVIAITRATGFAGHYLGDALPTLPSWTVAGYQWAPSVWGRPDGTFVMYYSTPATQPLDCVYSNTAPGCVETTHGANTAMCISRATSTSPSGPFVDDSTAAFICPTSQGGAIDPSIFVASDGTPWLLWKSDGDCCNLPTYIYSQQLSPDGLSTVGPPHELIGATQAWEGGLVEAPSMVQSGSTFWMFYSANLWGTPNYSIGIADCRSVTGPCTKPLNRAWHTSTNSANGQGYGGSEFFVAGGGLVWMVHHGLVPGQSGNYAERRLYVDLMVFPKNGIPEVAPRSPAAALAVEALYYQDPDLPSQPQAAYLHMVSVVPGTFTGISTAAELGDGRLACTDFARQEGTDSIRSALGQRHLNAFQSYVVSEFAAEYLCPALLPHALTDLRNALVAGARS
jgi:Glycosyl hydrolases family 43